MKEVTLKENAFGYEIKCSDGSQISYKRLKSVLWDARVFFEKEERVTQEINKLVASYYGKDTIISLLLLNEKTYAQLVTECQGTQGSPQIKNILIFQSMYQNRPIRILHSPQNEPIMAYQEVKANGKRDKEGENYTSRRR